MGNMFTLNIDVYDGKLMPFETIFDGNKNSKNYLAALTRTIISGLLGRLLRDAYPGENEMIDFGSRFLLSTNTNALSVGLGKSMEE
jgi:hypothetical protein